MDKLLRSAAGQIQITLAQAADTPPTVAIVDSAGVAVASGTSSTVVAPTYAFTLTPANLAILDVFTATWTATIGGVADTYTTYFETVGRHLFTVAEARAYDNGVLANTSTYTDAMIINAREEIADQLSDICGVSFVPRGSREILTGHGLATLDVKNVLRPSFGNPAGKLVSATVNGTALTAPEIADVEVRYRSLRRKTLGVWGSGTVANITVFYEHGYLEPPDAIRRAGLRLLRDKLVASNIDDRAVSFTDEMGQRTFLPVAGRKNQPFGIPDVDSTINQYCEVVGLVG